MSEQEILVKPKFSVKTFAPVWGAAVMGTGTLTSVFKSLAEFDVASKALNILAVVAFIITLIVAIPILLVTTIRWFKYPKEVREDLNHPVKGAMTGTFAGGFLVLAVAINRVGAEYLGDAATTILSPLFATIGAGLALYIGYVFITGVFVRGDVPKTMITGAWFIPPVVIIIVPTAIAPLLTVNNILSNEMLWISWVLLGKGLILYLVIVANMFYRAATAPLPPPQLAPSLIIGVGPAGLISLNLVLLTQASVRMGLISENAVSVSATLSNVMWGFGLWWLIATIIVLRRGYKKLNFSLTWWGFTFPLAAWVVAGFVTAKINTSILMLTISLLVGAFLLILWSYTAIKTIAGIKDKTIWQQ